MRRIALFLMLLFFATLVEAQSCTSASCNAVNTSEAAVLAAMPSPSNTNATVLVSIPGGTSSWTSDFVYTIPSAVTNLTVQGATAVNWTGTAGTSSWNYSAVDNTVIQDADPSNNSLMQFVTGSSTTKLRITGLTFKETTGGTKYGGAEVYLIGNSANFRFDHNHITGSGKQNEWLQTAGHVLGVIDHNAGDENPNNTNGDNYYRIFSTSDDTIGYGDGSWINGPRFGSLQQVYIESNYFMGGAASDCDTGGRFVARYNTFNDMYVPLQGHGTKSSGGAERGCLSYEAYHNYITGPGGALTASGAFGSKGGTQLIWGNTLAAGYYRFYEASTDRSGGDNAPEVNPPDGWGYCGTSTLTPSGGANGVGANWDGNQPSSSGYPCLDNLGRGQDTQALNGQWFEPVTSNGRLNTVTGTVAWPHQYLMPIYMWMNTLYSGATYALVTTTVSNNLDYYYDQTAQGGSFTGAAGTGFGTHAARPSTCTPGPGGTYYTSPTGSYGVGYFATDDNGGAGEFYVCDSTNHWQGIYQPAGYPHPLVSGGGGGGGLTSTSTSLSASNTTPPAGGTITLTATLTPSSGPTGTVTFFDFGSSIGTGTVSGGSATHTVTGISAGSHAYTASYGGDSSYSFSSSALLTVVTASTTGGSLQTPGGAFTAGVKLQ